MKKINPKNYLHYFLALGFMFSLLGDPQVLAQDEKPDTMESFAQDEEEEIVDLQEFSVVGSRSQFRAITDTPVPVSMIDIDEFENLGDTDMISMLATIIPSFNVNQQPISDAATLIRPANLRGLPSDSTLVFVNGKRRHRGSVITFLAGGIADGSQGVDLSALPSIAFKRVDVLHDGASAQYGSDAVAGVINFVLKDNPDGGTLTTQWGETYEGDGDTFTLSANVGAPLTEEGFINVSLEYKEAKPTSRSVQRADAQELIDAGNTAVRTPAAQIWGAPEFKYDFKSFINMGLDLGGSEVYSFVSWAKREIEGGFYFRNPNTRGGVFRGPVVDGSPTIRVADLTGDMSANPPVVKITNNVPDAAALAAVAADPNTFAFNERFPGGFTPQFGGTITDASLAFGIKGESSSDWFYDLSFGLGRSNADFFIKNTINPQLATQKTNIPTRYDPGAYTETDRVVNLDISRRFDNNVFASPLNVAFGGEYRGENFKIENGELNSFFIDPNLAAQGFGVGSNGFPGFKPEDAGVTDRVSYAGYIDLEAYAVDNLLVGVAARYEDYEDFGSTLNGKVTARAQLNDNFALRGSLSSGFRAPTVGQSSVRNVTTAFIDGQLADQATLPPTDPISVQKGGRALQPETSVNIALGTVFKLGEVDLSIDYYNIKLEDRISLTSEQILTRSDIDSLLSQGHSDASSFTAVRFFTNDFDTTTQGLDIAASYSTDLFGGDNTILSFVANWNQTEVDRFNPDIIDPVVRVGQLEKNLPEVRFSLTANHYRGPWRFLGRVHYYDDFLEFHANQVTLPINGTAKWLFDTEVAYTFNDTVTFVVGAKNMFNNYPTENPHAQVVGAKYAESSPYGFNGGFYYFKAIWKFL